MNLFLQIVEKAAQLIDGFDDYDVSAIEYHHNQKVDSPSGSAKTIAQALIDNISRKQSATYDRVDSKITPETIHFSSVRCGSIPGTFPGAWPPAAAPEGSPIQRTGVYKNRGMSQSRGSLKQFRVNQSGQ